MEQILKQSKKSKKGIIRSWLIIFTLTFGFLFSFYFVESFEAYRFKNKIIEALKQNNSEIDIPKLVTEKADYVCALGRDTVGRSSLYELEPYISDSHKSDVPDTFSYNYNFHLLLLKAKVPVKVISLKSTILDVLAKSYRIEAKEMVQCFPFETSIFKIINTNGSIATISLEKK